MSSLVFLDPAYPAGRLADINAPQLPVTLQGVNRGDGVFESMLYTQQAVRKIEAHLARLAVSAEASDLPIPDERSWRAAVDTAVADFDATGGAEEAVVKLVAMRGELDQDPAVCWVTVTPAPRVGMEQRETGVDVLFLDRGYDSKLAERAPWLLMGAKTLSYAVNMAALRYARKHGAHEVIFTSADGVVLEAPTATVLLAQRDGETRRLLTPMLETGILPAPPRAPSSTPRSRTAGSWATARCARRTCTRPTACGWCPRSACSPRCAPWMPSRSGWTPSCTNSCPPWRIRSASPGYQIRL